MRILGLNYVKNMRNFGPLFVLKKRAWPTFNLGFCGLAGQKINFGPLFVGFGPLLKTKPGHEKPSIYAGLRAFGPLSHFFSLLIVREKIRK